MGLDHAGRTDATEVDYASWRSASHLAEPG
jgi:hypothetical protein